MDLLSRIKRLILADCYAFSRQALDQMDEDGLTELDVLESVTNAQFVRSKRSSSLSKRRARERVYIIESFSFSGVLIYTKGTIRKDGASEKFYFFISSKRSTTA